jgi:hypothetical protein
MDNDKHIALICENCNLQLPPDCSACGCGNRSFTKLYGGEAAPAPQAATNEQEFAQLRRKQSEAEQAWAFLEAKGVKNLDIERDGKDKVTLTELLAEFANGVFIGQAEAPRPSAPNTYAKVAARNLRFYAELIERGEIDAKNVEALSESVFIHSLREYASYIEQAESRPSAEEVSKEVIKYIATEAIKLLFTRNCGSLELDEDAATEDEMAQDVVNVLVGDDQGCLDDDDPRLMETVNRVAQWMQERITRP